MTTMTRRYTNLELKRMGGLKSCKFCVYYARFKTSGNGKAVWHCKDHKRNAQEALQEIV